MGGAVDDCATSGCSGSHDTDLVKSPLRRLTDNTLRITRRVLPYFIGGIALAALLFTVIPADAIPRLVGGSGGVVA